MNSSVDLVLQKKQYKHICLQANISIQRVESVLQKQSQMEFLDAALKAAILNPFTIIYECFIKHRNIQTENC